MPQGKLTKIEISHRTVIFTVLFLLSLYFLLAIKGILIALFISYLLATALYPAVNWLARIGIPRGLSAALLLILTLAAIFVSIASVLPPMIQQTTNFIMRLPALIDRLGVYRIDTSVFTSQLSSLSANLVKVALDTFTVAVLLITIFVIGFYLIIERARLDEHLRVLFGDRAEHYRKLIEEIETNLGHWVRTMIFLMFLIGIQTYIGLFLIGIEYALPLAIIAGLLEIIPNLGPTIATIPAAIVGFATSPLHGFLVLALYILVQQIENNLIVPNLMKKTVGLHPVVTIIALLIGFELGGALLAVLSLPLVLVGRVLLYHFYTHHSPPNLGREVIV